MSDDDSPFDPEKTLADHAEQLNAISSPAWWPRIFYDIMSGALIWSDETNSKTPVEVIWALRCIVAYRTSLMLNEPQEEFKPMWNLGLSLFPKWVGFRPERRQATPKLLRIYRRGEANLDQMLIDAVGEMEQEDAEPDAPVDGGDTKPD